MSITVQEETPVVIVEEEEDCCASGLCDCDYESEAEELDDNSLE